MDKLTTAEVIKAIEIMTEIVIEKEVEFCELDSIAGDGDFGMSLAKGFKILKRDWATIDRSDIGTFFTEIGMLIMENCGGASGSIWGSAFRGMGKAAGNVSEINLADLAKIIQAAVSSIQRTGEKSFGRGAVVGDKTLIDALVPAADSLSASADANEEMLSAMKKAAAAAVEGAEKTKTFAARMGRAGNVGDRSLGHPDAGAVAIGVLFTGIVSKMWS
jgi:dihydroxyacetone kinase